MHAVEKFNFFFKEFQTTSIWRSLLLTRENSPWHREENVGEHTRMLISWYSKNLLWKRNDRQRIMTMLACLFHDVGKPHAEVTKVSNERGEYRSYAGHEQISARTWVDFALTSSFILNELRFSVSDISNIALMIEHHVPFSLKNSRKRISLKSTLINRLGHDGHQAWIDLLLSDQHGRHSDDQAEKLKRVDEWIQEWNQLRI